MSRKNRDAPAWLMLLSGLAIGFGLPLPPEATTLDLPIWVFWLGVGSATITCPPTWDWLRKRFARKP